MLLPTLNHWQPPAPRLDVHLENGSMHPVDCSWPDLLLPGKGRQRLTASFRLAEGKHVLADAFPYHAAVRQAFGGLTLDVVPHEATWCSIQVHCGQKGSEAESIPLDKCCVDFSAPYPRLLGLSSTGWLTPWQKTASRFASTEILRLSLDSDGRAGEANLRFAGQVVSTQFFVPSLGAKETAPENPAEEATVDGMPDTLNAAITGFLTAHQSLGFLSTLLGKVIVDHEDNRVRGEAVFSDSIPWALWGGNCTLLLPAIRRASCLWLSGTLSRAPAGDGICLTLSDDEGLKAELPGGMHLHVKGMITATASYVATANIVATVHGLEAEAFLAPEKISDPAADSSSLAEEKIRPASRRHLLASGQLRGSLTTPVVEISAAAQYGENPRSSWKCKLTDVT